MRTKTGARLALAAGLVMAAMPVAFGAGDGSGIGSKVSPAGARASRSARVPTGRSAAIAGTFCETPTRTCLLGTAALVGGSCSCLVSGGGASPGRVSP